MVHVNDSFWKKQNIWNKGSQTLVHSQNKSLRDEKLPWWVFGFNLSCSFHEKTQQWEIKKRFKSAIQVTNRVIYNLFAASNEIYRLPMEALINRILITWKDETFLGKKTCLGCKVKITDNQIQTAVEISKVLNFNLSDLRIIYNNKMFKCVRAVQMPYWIANPEI